MGRIERESPGLRATARAQGWWDGQATFNWAEVIGSATGDLESPDSRFRCGTRLLGAVVSGDKAPGQLRAMLGVLRDEDSQICRRPGTSAFPTAASQASLLAPSSCCHWFTATPDPVKAVFKPFLFEDPELLTLDTKSPAGKNLRPEQRQHRLGAAQGGSKAGVEELGRLEEECLQRGVEAMEGGRASGLFNWAVKEEMIIHLGGEEIF